MKKAALILLILIYATSSFGVGLKEFYCCGKLKSVSVTLGDTEKDKCSKGDNKDGCCKTKFQFFKVKDSHVAAAHLDAPINHFADLHLTTPLWQVNTTVKIVDVINGSHAPPLYQNLPIYISNCVFRI